MIPEFMRFYNYTLKQVLDEWGQTFYALIDSMRKLKALERLTMASDINMAVSGNEELRKSLVDQAGGNSALLEQSKILRDIKNVN
jgi:hypothetical protein